MEYGFLKNNNQLNNKKEVESPFESGNLINSNK